MAKYLLLLHEAPNAFPPDISPADIQVIIKKYLDWGERMRREGHYVGGDKLKDGEGRCLRNQGGKVSVRDGPYVEAREVVGGFYILHAKDYAAAVEAAGSCPHLEFGTIEIREIEPTG